MLKNRFGKKGTLIFRFPSGRRGRADLEQNRAEGGKREFVGGKNGINKTGVPATKVHEVGTIRQGGANNDLLKE